MKRRHLRQKLKIPKCSLNSDTDQTFEMNTEPDRKTRKLQIILFLQIFQVSAHSRRKIFTEIEV